MKSIKIYSSLLLAALVSFTSCETEDDLRQDIIDNTTDPFDPPPPTAEPGTANFTTYVSIGASITSGFMDGAIYNAGQVNSYPNLLSAQLAIAGGGSFSQPNVNSINGYNSLLNDLSTAFEEAEFGRFKLNTSIPAPEAIAPGQPLTLFAGAVNNFGIPGVRLVDATANGYGSFNPYFKRFESSATASILEDALAVAPTFYTLWLGSNDVLLYASAGGTTSQATNPPPTGIAPGISDYYVTNAPANTNSTTATELMDPSGMTSEAVFEQAYTGVLGALEAGADGVVINIPDVTLSPAFNLVSPELLAVPLDLSEELPDEVSAGLGLPSGSTSADALNALYAQYGFTAGEEIFENSAENSMIIETHDSDGNRVFRQITSNDKVIFSIPRDSLAIGWGTVKGIVFDENGDIDFEETDLSALLPFPIPSQYIIDAGELEAVQERVVAFNEIIDSVAGGLGVSVVDINAVLLQAAIDGGISVSGQFLNYDFSPNGFFSTDGVHPNSRGQGIIANETIAVINAAFGSTLPDVNVLILPGITVK